MVRSLATSGEGGSEGGSPAREDALHGSGFLTTAQREQLDAAVREKQKAGKLERTRSHGEEVAQRGGRGSLDLARPGKERPHDRHSRTRGDKAGGRPKKGGAGGKWVWGASLDAESAGSGAADPNDPNYDSSEEKGVTNVTLRTAAGCQASLYKAAVIDVVREFFASGDAGEAATALQDLGEPQFGHYFVKKLVAAALDCPDRARELAAGLLSRLYAAVLPPEQIEKGFLLLAEGVEDLTLDVPAASELIAQFLARAVTDDILPPSFLAKLPAEEGLAGAAVRRAAEAQLQAPHAAERILRRWGGQAGGSFAGVQAAIAQLLQEYLVSADLAEAQACLRALALPPAHHELVKQALRLALSQPRAAPALLRLLGHLARAGAVSEDQILKGFKRLADSLADLQLDIPTAPAGFQQLCADAEAQGWLPAPELRRALQPPPPAAAAALTSGVAAFKARAAAAVKEYFGSGDASEAGRCLAELQQPGLHSLAVKLAVQLGLEARDREREAVATLLAALCPSVFTADQVALGFTRLLACAEDLQLDCPDAARQLALTLGRVVVDELLPPAFLTGVLPSLRDDSLGVAVVQATGKLLSARHAAERLQLCWAPGARSVEAVKGAIKELVAEYVASGDACEAARCWRELGCGFFGHQLVVAVLLAAFDRPANCDRLLRLVGRLAASGELSQTQIQKGFERVELQLSDLRLDYPASPKEFDTCKAAAQQHGWLGSAAQA